MSNKNFFNIDLKHLKNKKIFGFNIYIYNPNTKDYAIFLYANSPLTNDKKELMKFIVQRGGKIAIMKKQQKSFLFNMELKQEEVPTIAEKKVHALEKSQAMYKESLRIKEEKPDGKFLIMSEMKRCFQSENFEKIIERARDEILCFDVKTSHTVSLAILLAEKHLLNPKSFSAKIVALSYFVAKLLKIYEEETLSTVIVGAFFHHLGVTQLEHDIIKTPMIELNDSQKHEMKKHASMSGYLLQKSGIEVNDRVQRVINEHHERSDGNGYPRAKTSETIDTISFIIGLCSHLLEFSQGHILGQKKALYSTLKSIKNISTQPGLELHFGPKLYDIITDMCFDNNSKTA